MATIGVFGGSFDPIHIGHLAIAEEVRWQLGLDAVWLVPTAQQPLKAARHTASPADRAAMVAAAIADHSQFALSRHEIEQPGPSYTVATLAAFRSQFPADDFVFIIGADALTSLQRWHQIERLVSLCRFAVVGRPGVAVPPAAALPAGLRWELVAGPQLAISATEVRQRIRTGAPFRYHVHPAVYDYITAHGLYQEQE